MRKNLFLILIACILGVMNGFANAESYDTITTNPKIQSALAILQASGNGDVITTLNGANATGKVMKVMFRELEVYGLSKCEAATLKTKSGGVVIYINKKYQDAPAEAIACLIAHESQHSALTGTKAEEVRAWLREVTAWNSIVRYNPQIVNNPYPLLKRFKYINKLYVADNNGPKKIEEVIASHPVYANLH